MPKPLVYMCCPYTKGHVNANVKDSCNWWEVLRISGHVIPHNPLWSHVQDLLIPLEWSDWMAYDFDLIRSGKFDALFVIPSDVPSKGVEAEIKLANELGIPVFRDVLDMNEWAKDFG